MLGIDGTAAPLNVFISGPIALAFGVGLGVVIASVHCSRSRFLAMVGVVSVAMIALGLLLNYFG